MRVEDLIAQCPAFSRVTFYATANSRDLFLLGAAGDAVHLEEVNENGPTGNRITVLVIGGSFVWQLEVRSRAKDGAG